jgi:plastocyanin
MNKKGVLTIVIVIIAILIIGGVIFYLATSDKGTEGEGKSAAASALKVKEEERLQSYTVEITSSGFSPSNLEIKAGDSVTWINKDSAQHWPASAVHPTHKVYPGSDIAKCDTAEQSKIFDACKGLVQGESWTFTFNEKGSWNYHDHLVSERVGKIIVN